VRGFIKRYADGPFDPAVISILEDAFDDAWRRVQASKAPSSAEEYAPAAQMILAKYIIEAAQTGERDPRWLADSALLYLSAEIKPNAAEELAIVEAFRLACSLRCDYSAPSAFAPRATDPATDRPVAPTKRGWHGHA